MFAKTVIDYFYRQDLNAEELPWHTSAPTKAMKNAISAPCAGKALDIGCGSGAHSIYLAKQGFEVTAIDSSPVALEMAQLAASEAGVDIDVVEADILNWEPPSRFDFLFDRGCMHSFDDSLLDQYKSQILSWMGEQGTYVLVHVCKRHVLDWSPFGPVKRTPQEIMSFFSPELTEIGNAPEEFSRPLAFGPTYLTHGYCFRKQIHKH